MGAGSRPFPGFRADLPRSAAELGYRPTTEFEEGVRRQWEWMKEAGAS